jgi:hypothetical protein
VYFVVNHELGVDLSVGFGRSVVMASLVCTSFRPP